MITSEISQTFGADIKSVWDIVTDSKNYKWRSDIKRVEVSEDEKTFSEYSTGGVETKFTITKKTPYNEYEFNLENKIFDGNFIGSFQETSDGGTCIHFTENVTLKNSLFKIFSGLISRRLSKMQETYVKDLRRELHEWINNL